MKFLSVYLLVLGCVSPCNRESGENSTEKGRSLSSESGNNISNSNDNICNQNIRELEKQFQKINVNISQITYLRPYEDYMKNFEELFKLVNLIETFKKNQKELNEIKMILLEYSDKKLPSKVSSDLSSMDKNTKVCNEETLKKSAININTLAQQLNNNLQKDYHICQNKIKNLSVDNKKETELDQYNEDMMRIKGYNKFLRVILPHLSILEDSKTIPAKMNTSQSL
jgi:methionine synthase II (cobalamin-independent)